MKIEHQLLHFLISPHYLSIIPNYYINHFECDLFALNKNLYSTEFEIKKTLPDYKKDFSKGTKYFQYNKHLLIKEGKRTNYFYFVCDDKMKFDLPEYAGLITFEKSSFGVQFNRNPAFAGLKL